MKKSLIIISFLVFCLTGCNNCVDIEYTNVEAKIINTSYKEAETEYYFIGSAIGIDEIPEEYITTISYGNKKYELEGRKIYDFCKTKIGQEVTAILETYTYADGSMQSNITKLEMY